MHPVAASLTAVALIVHALLGCCWHHAHLAQSAVEGGDAIRPVVHGDHVHWHDGEHDRSDDTRHHHDGDSDCDEAQCTYAGGASRVQIQSPLTGLELPLLAPTISLVAGRLDAAYVSHTPAGDSRGASLHLLYQVLVI